MEAIEKKPHSDREDDRGEVMKEPDEVAVMLRLKELGWGVRRIARELGCSHMTVRRYIAAGGWTPTKVTDRPSALDGLEGWLAERLRRHRGNADVVRQDLAREHGIAVSLRTTQRACLPHRRALEAEARATVRFETPPGHQLQVDFGEVRTPVAGESGRLFLFVATLGYSRRPYVRAFRHERQSAWLEGIEGAFRHFPSPSHRPETSESAPRSALNSTLLFQRNRPNGGLETLVFRSASRCTYFLNLGPRRPILAVLGARSCLAPPPASGSA